MTFTITFAIEGGGLIFEGGLIFGRLRYLYPTSLRIAQSSYHGVVLAECTPLSEQYFRALQEGGHSAAETGCHSCDLAEQCCYTHCTDGTVAHTIAGFHTGFYAGGVGVVNIICV